MSHIADPQQLAADPSSSAWVAASAGTGKTHVLTNRVLRLLLAGAAPDRLLCLTYTKAAATEMLTRLSRRLAEWAVLPDAKLSEILADLQGRAATPGETAKARQLFAAILDVPGGLKIQTIHSFCQSLLGRFPVEAGIAPHFDIMDDRTTEETRADVLLTLLAETGRPGREPLAAALAHLAAALNEERFAKLIGQALAERGKLERLLTPDLGSALTRLQAKLGFDGAPSADAILHELCSGSDDNALRRAADWLDGGTKTDRERAAGLRAWLRPAAADRAALWTDYRDLFLKTTDGGIRANLVNKAVADAHPDCIAILAGEADRVWRCDQTLRAVRLHDNSAALLTVADALLAAYEQAKDRKNVLDYDDLILKTRDLLDRPGIAPWILYKLDGGLDHMLVDEAQDTNPDQWHTIEALTQEFFAGEGARDQLRTLFVVGDVKQSIYSFQRAEPRLFVRYGERFRRRAADAGLEFPPVPLHRSFRSTAAVLGVVDAVFALPTPRAGVQFDDAVIAHEAARVGHSGLVECWPLIAPAETAPDAPWVLPDRRRGKSDPQAELAQRIADTVAGWLRDGETLAARGRAVRPGDIMILVRRRGRFADLMVRALKDCKVAVAGTDRMRLNDQIAVMDLMAMGHFALLPEDDLNLAALLKSPLVGLEEQALFDLAQTRGPGQSLWSALQSRRAERPEFAAASALLEGVLARADYVPPYDFFVDILEQGAARLRARLGQQADDPLDEFLAQALAFERQHPASLQGFLHWLQAGNPEVKRDLEQGRDEVRILTVHGAKGLQAPIVFLPDSGQTPDPRGTDIYWDGDLPLWPGRGENAVGPAADAKTLKAERDREEYYRLLYVALTRAEDRLYVCGWQSKGNAGNWHELVTAALSAMPGAQQRDGLWRLAQEQIATPQDQSRPRDVAASNAATPGWARETAAPFEPTPPRPLAPSRLGDEPAVKSPIALDEDGIFQRGLLIHRLMQSLPALPPAHRREAARLWLAQPARGLSGAQIDALLSEAMGVLDNPAFADLFGPASRAEVPIAGLVADDLAISGQIDRLAVTDREVWAIDFKTNRPPPADLAAVPQIYLRQMAAYRAALQAIYPDHKIRCALLWTDGARLMELPEKMLQLRTYSVA